MAAAANACFTRTGLSVAAQVGGPASLLSPAPAAAIYLQAWARTPLWRRAEFLHKVGAACCWIEDDSMQWQQLVGYAQHLAAT